MTKAKLHPVVEAVTADIFARSKDARTAYLDRITTAGESTAPRGKLSCANFAHAFAASPAADKIRALDPSTVNIGIVTAYNDMLSAHQPYETYPGLIRDAAREVGATAQVAGGVPAMCDGVTQGRPGMELSLFSRDVIAMASAIALSHDAFDAALHLGICDKIVPGLVMGALSFGHIPSIFVPAGPMSSGSSNEEKARVRALYAEGKAGRDELMASEMASYHGPGTCTFYGTANSNQMMMEMMGLHLPGAAFVHPHTPLREALTKAAAHRAAEIALGKQLYTPVGKMLDEKSFVNALQGLLATGGSTNHTLHLIAMAAAGGITLTWDDMDRLSHVTPLIARVYPNGSSDVNAFHAAGGMAFVIKELLRAGLAHEDVMTVAGPSLERYTEEPYLTDDGVLAWRPGTAESLAPDILRPYDDPFDVHGGVVLVKGNLGRAVAKVSAVKPEYRMVEAPAVVFDSPEDLNAAFNRGELNKDLVAVVRFQGPKAMGMPELHSLTPCLTVLMGRGHKVALVTDGRMSGASGKILSAIHVTPEAVSGGPIARIQSGDIIRVDGEAGVLEVKVAPDVLAARPLATFDLTQHQTGFGRELFTRFRESAGPADAGGSPLF